MFWARGRRDVLFLPFSPKNHFFFLFQEIPPKMEKWRTFHPKTGFGGEKGALPAQGLETAVFPMVS